MLNKKGDRELCYLVSVDEINELPGYDRVESARIGGWHCIVPKGQFHPGSIGIYFEIDSKVDEINPVFEFMAKRKYRVKTQKMCGSISQGLLMHPNDFGWIEDSNIIKNGKDYYNIMDESRFLTSVLKVTYYEAEDNTRKAASADKYKLMANRHQKLFKKPLFRWLMRREWGKKLLFMFFGKKKDKKSEWPAWVTKTDEERAQNLPHLFSNPDGMHWIATEKIDGSSTTFTMINDKKKELLVCSRNVVFNKPDQKCYYDSNIYIEMAEKYDVENVMRKYLQNHPEVKYFTIQGETYGNKVQRRDYGMKERDFKIFNIIFHYEDGTSRRLNPIEGTEFAAAQLNIPFVPIVATDYVLPSTCDELIAFAHGTSAVDGGLREGLVFRSEDGVRSFKGVDPEFLMKYHN